MKTSVSMNAYEQRQYNEIQAYKNEEPSVLQKVTGTLFAPLSWLVEKVIPNRVIEGALKGANHAGKFFTDKDDILRDGGVSRIEELQHKDLQLSDEMADSVHNWAIGLATTEGGITGALGLVGIAADIPTLITMSFREIHKIGLCYGYECNSEHMQNVVFQIFSIAGANNMKEKYSSLLLLKRFQNIIVKETWKEIVEKASAKSVSEYAFLAALKKLAEQLGINFSKRKALQAIPVFGGFIGASMNASFLSDIGWAARRVFQEMWLAENKKIILDAEDVEFEECA